MNFLKRFLLVVNIALFICSIGFTLIGLVDEIFGPAKTEWLLNKLNIQLSYGWFMLVGLICVVAALLLYYARRRWFKE